jgi:predicted RNA-binding Zn ribbon-like protein
MGSEAKASGETPQFDLCAGHAALDLVNSLDNRFHAEGPRELLNAYADLVRLAEQSRLLDAARARQLRSAATPKAAARALSQARELREALAALLYGILDGRPPRASDLRTLERHFHRAAAHRELAWRAAGGDHGHGDLQWQRGRFAPATDLPVWLLAQEASELLLSGALARVRACGSESCRWLFLDTSKNHTRRWCNMKVCGNRMKARRFQARHGAAT